MWNTPVDIYCERLDTTFWAEPINAMTNIGFIFASFLAIYIHKKDGLNNKVFIFLSLLVVLIGVGSFLFHTFANTWSGLADTIPIWSFVVLYVFFVIKIVFNNSWVKTIFIMIIVFALSYLGLYLSKSENDNNGQVLNGSLQYSPALFFMIVYTVMLYIKKQKIFKYAAYALLVFFISLCFRTIDMYLCESLSIGTHFVWHILNALMLFLLLLTFHKSLREY